MHVPELDGWHGSEVAMHNDAYFGHHYAVDNVDGQPSCQSAKQRRSNST